MCEKNSYTRIKQRIKELEKESLEKDKADSLIKSILKSTERKSGTIFFRELVKQVASVVGFKHVFIGELIRGKAERVKTLAVWGNGSFKKNIEYDLLKTPCEEVAKQEICYYPKNIQALFPEDHLLAKMETESYLGIPLVDLSGHTIGLVVALHDKPMEGLLFAKPILSIFAGRIAGEIERERAEKKLKRSNTELEQAEKALRESEGCYKSLVDNIDILITQMDSNYNIIMGNAALGKTWRKPVDEFIGKKCYHEFENKANICAHCPGKKAMDTGIPHDVITHSTRGDGSLFIVWNRAFPTFGDDGKITGFVEIGEDITEKKRIEKAFEESERKFSALFENMSEGVSLNSIIFDEKGIPRDYVIVDVNPAYEHHTGLQKTNIQGRKASEIYGSDGVPYFDIFANVAISGEATSFETYSEKMQKHFYVSVCSPGKGTFATVFEDVTGRKEIEETLRKQTIELERSNKDLEQFAYLASHDLKEPLRMVNGYVSLLGKRYKGKLDADADEFIKYAVEGTTRMENLIGDLLLYSRVTTQGKEFRRVDCNDILSEVIRNLQINIEESGTVITCEGLPTVTGDSIQLCQLLQNLINNAIKFCSSGHPEIEIIVRPKDGDWLFGIADNGIGIDNEYSEHIFEIFKRLHTKEEYDGSGIGLSICKKIVERHGGRIWVESEINSGSTFYFTLSGE